jgi:hypothetical protein
MPISDKKKFALKVFVFAVCMVLVDCLCGICFPLLQSHAKGGSTRMNYYVSDECDVDILVLGSSRAQHHYVPRILDSLGGVAYNAGNDGMGAVLGLGRYQMCAEKHVPKIVIHDISSFDYQRDDNSKYLKYLRPYGDRPYIRNIISQIGEPFIDLKMLSNMYRNSSRIIPNIRDLFANDNPDNRGYLPLYKKCKNCDHNSLKVDSSSLVLDSIKLKIFDQFILETTRRGSKLYFAISPKFSSEIGESSDSLVTHKLPPSYAYAESLAKRYNIPLLNNMYILGISDNPDFFADQTHLNNEGALAYSRKIVQDLRNSEGP